MTSEQVLSINELALLRLSCNSEQADRGGGGQFSFAAEKAYESSQSENIPKSPTLDNPRLAKALEWCYKRKLERDKLSCELQFKVATECCHSHR